MDETLVEEIVLRYRAIVPMTTLGDHLLFMTSKVLRTTSTRMRVFIASCFGRATLRSAVANATMRATSRSRPVPPKARPTV